jgi:hypothetical protein
MPRRAELGALGQVSTFIVPSGDIGGVMAEFGIVEPLVKQRRLGSVAWIIQRSAESGTAVRLTGLLTAVIAAYHYSLWSLVRGEYLHPGLVVLAIVPIVALAVATVRLRLPVSGPEIHDRQLDYIAGCGLIVAAMALMSLTTHHAAIPTRWRLDLLSLPVFTAGAITLTFGIRATWRSRSALMFLLLAWPPLWTHVRPRLVQGPATVSSAVITAVGSRFSLASPGLHPGTKAVPYRSAVLILDSTLAHGCLVTAVLILGGGLLTSAHGLWRDKLSWFIATLAPCWSLDLIRLFLALAAGRVWGRTALMVGTSVAAQVLTVAVGVGAMATVAHCFGLSWSLVDWSSALPARSRKPAVGRVRLALMVLGCAAAVSALMNAHTSSQLAEPGNSAAMGQRMPSAALLASVP